MVSVKRVPRCLASFSAVAAAAVLLSGCGRREKAVARGDREQILYLGNGSEPKGLDPHLVTGVTEHNVIAALLEGLVAEDPEDLHPVPGVATSWDVSDDGKRYTFHLRESARWSNGDPVTADHFVYSFRRILTPDLAAEYAYMLYPLVNAEAFNTGKVADFDDVGAKAADSRTLVLELENPTPYLLELLNHYSWWPVHPPTVEAFGGIGNRESQWTRPGNFVGNGPFALKSWEVNRHIVVAKSPSYWDATTVRLKEIHFLPIDSADTEERAFRDGGLHVTGTIPLHRIDYYRENRPDQIRFDTYLGTYFYRFNVTEPPLDDKRVRLALGLVINRGDITRFILKAGQQPAYHFTPPGTAGYTPKARLDASADRARELLAEAGFPSGAGFPSLSLLFNTSEAHRTIAEAIQQMWKKELNIDVTLRNQEWKVYLDSVKRLDYQVARAAWIGDYNDPNTFLDMWVTDGGNNRTGWTNPEYDRLLKQASRSVTSEERLACFQQAEAILLEEVPIVPIYFYVRSMLIQPSVRGWHPTILDHHPYKHVYLQPR
ncbi:MAG: peptide ABC transporter substrate-binding protein [Lentisphaerae bacterium]|nr:peptide ABC transporter substrate-binding protein [Lentisphaerota bacterium]